jgi:hypothetical protein
MPIAFFAVLCAFSPPALGQRITLGPVPPPGTDMGLLPPSRAQVVLTDVPAYIWHHGCGPTATGMIIGYYDGEGYPDLVPGSAAAQTAAVNAMIADDSGHPDCSYPDGDHYQDYACPRDDSGPLLPDRSQTGGAHGNNCVADFMRTSWSSVGNHYGWSWGSDVADAFNLYVQLRTQYPAWAESKLISQFSWAAFKAEIDAGRPVGLLVDTDGDGQTDHFVPAIGYDSSNNYYACRNTWDTGVHWYDWSSIAAGNPWGIYLVTTYYFWPIPDLVIDDLQFSPAAPQFTDPVSVRALVHNIGTEAADPFTVLYRVDGVNGPSASVGALAAGASVWTAYQMLGTLSAGIRAIEGYADGSGAIIEADESNNSRTENLVVNDAAGVGDAPSPVAALRIEAVNPWSAEDPLVLELGREASVTLALYDVCGREVKLLLSGTLPTGTHRVRWDGRTNSGLRVKAGMYFLRVQTGTERAQRAIFYRG